MTTTEQILADLESGVDFSNLPDLEELTEDELAQREQEKVSKKKAPGTGKRVVLGEAIETKLGEIGSVFKLKFQGASQARSFMTKMRAVARSHDHGISYDLRAPEGITLRDIQLTYPKNASRKTDDVVENIGGQKTSHGNYTGEIVVWVEVTKLDTSKTGAPKQN